MDGTKTWTRLLVKNVKKQDARKKKFVLKLGGLALLLSEIIRDVLGEIYVDAIRDFQNNEHTGDDFDYSCCEFVDAYFESYWMDRVTPEGFSVFNEIDRTNNKLESYHSQLPEILGIRPMLTVFLRELIILSFICFINS